MLSTEMLMDGLLFAAGINYALLLLWFALFSLAHDWLQRLHGRWFQLRTEHFDAIHYAAMAFFKLAIFMFFLAPYLALRLMS